MAANTSPIFSLTPKVGMATISTANTNRDGTGTLGTIVTGGTNGTRVDGIVVQATGTTTAGMVRLFVFDGASTTQMIDEVPVSAVTPSGTTQAFRVTRRSPDPQTPLLVLPQGYILKAGTHNAESFSVVALGGDY
jgi:hypothetical protein